MLGFGGLQLESQLVGTLEIGQRKTCGVLYSGNERSNQRQQNLGMLRSLLEQLLLVILLLGFEKALQFAHALFRLLRHALSPGQCLRNVKTWLHVSYEHNEV